MLYTRLKTDRITAQKAGDAFLVGVLKLILSELSYAQVDNKNGELSDEIVENVLRKEAKKRKDSIEAYTKANAEDRAEMERKELTVIESYLPVQMTEEAALAEITKISLETGLTGGKLIGAVMAKLKGKIDGSVVLKLVNGNFA